MALVGPDDGAEEEARRRVASLRMDEAVHFVGWLAGPEKLAAYRAADVYVLPSRFDVFSIGLVEAMACGAPVVVSRGCALAGEIEGHGLGSVVDYGAVADLAEALYEALSRPAGARERAARGRDWALSTYDWKGIVTEVEKLYRDCLESLR